MSFETRTAKWGTYGKGGIEHCMGRCSAHQFRWKLLTDCDTEHLQMILRNQRQVERHPVTKSIIHRILIGRGEKPEMFSVEAETLMFRQCAEAERNFPQRWPS